MALSSTSFRYKVAEFMRKKSNKQITSYTSHGLKVLGCCCVHKGYLQMSTAFLALVFCEIVLTSSGLRMVMLDIPSPASVGESVELTCSYDLEYDSLYSIKWYKNDIEFYRYVPNDWPPGQFLPLPGIRVDLSKSNKRSVYLRNIDLNSTGTYRCEVSAESPSFQTVEAEAEMTVIVLPTEGPTISGGQPKYDVGDVVAINCTSAKSKPAATLRWYINDDPVVQQGTDYDTEYATTLHADGLETSSLSLRFVADSKHFKDQNMRLKCTASISMLYSMSNEELFVGGNQQSSPLQINAEIQHRQPIKSTQAQTERASVVEKVSEGGGNDDVEEDDEPTSASMSAYSINHHLLFLPLILLLVALFSCTAIKHRCG